MATLRQHAPQLRKRGVDHLYVFGSVARGDARVDGEIDLAIDVAPDADFSLLDLVGVKQEAEDLLGWPTDLVGAQDVEALRPTGGRARGHPGLLTGEGWGAKRLSGSTTFLTRSVSCAPLLPGWMPPPFWPIV